MTATRVRRVKISCIAGSTASTGSLTRAAVTTPTDQKAPRVVAVTVEPNRGVSSRVSATPAAAGVSQWIVGRVTERKDAELVVS